MKQPRNPSGRFLRFLVLTASGAILLASPLQAAEPKLAVNGDAESPAKKSDPVKPDKDGWLSLLDARLLTKWKVLDEFDFADHGKIQVSEKGISLEQGFPATGVKWTGDFPTTDYEVSLEARRVYGDDFFCGLTFPVGDKALTLVCGGWGGQVTGLSCIDGESAIDNDTCHFEEYQQQKWYRIRVCVRKDRIDAWLDDKHIVDLPLKARELSLRWEMEPVQPFGVCTWNTSGELKSLRYRKIDEKTPAKSQEAAPKSE